MVRVTKSLYLSKIYISNNLKKNLKIISPYTRWKRGGEARNPAGLITPRSVVQVHPPLPNSNTLNLTKDQMVSL